MEYPDDMIRKASTAAFNKIGRGIAGAAKKPAAWGGAFGNFFGGGNAGGGNAGVNAWNKPPGWAGTPRAGGMGNAGGNTGGGFIPSIMGNALVMNGAAGFGGHMQGAMAQLAAANARNSNFSMMNKQGQAGYNLAQGQQDLDRYGIDANSANQRGWMDTIGDVFGDIMNDFGGGSNNVATAEPQNRLPANAILGRVADIAGPSINQTPDYSGPNAASTPDLGIGGGRENEIWGPEQKIAADARMAQLAQTMAPHIGGPAAGNAGQMSSIGELFNQYARGATDKIASGLDRFGTQAQNQHNLAQGSADASGQMQYTNVLRRLYQMMSQNQQYEPRLGSTMLNYV